MSRLDGVSGSLAFGKTVNNGGFEVVQPLEKSLSEFSVVGSELDEFFRDAQRKLLDFAVVVSDFRDSFLDESSSSGAPLVDDSDGGVGLVDGDLRVGASVSPFLESSAESGIGGGQKISV